MNKKISQRILALSLALLAALPAYSQLQPTPRDTSVVSLLFGADVNSSIANYDAQPTFGLATIGLNYFRNGWDASLRFNAISTPENGLVSSSSAKTFGRVLLTPGFGGASFRSLFIDASTPYFSDLLKNKRSGFLRRFRLNGYLYSGATQWDYTADGNSAIYEGLLFSSGLNGSLTFAHTFHGDNTISLTFHAGFTSRFIAGDLAQSGANDEIRNLRTELLKSDAKAFGGLEFGATLRFNWVYARLNMLYFDGDAAGFNGLQDIASAGIMTDIHLTKARKFYPVKEKRKVTRRGSSMKR